MGKITFHKTITIPPFSENKNAPMDVWLKTGFLWEVHQAMLELAKGKLDYKAYGKSNRQNTHTGICCQVLRATDLNVQWIGSGYCSFAFQGNS